MGKTETFGVYWYVQMLCNVVLFMLYLIQPGGKWLNRTRYIRDIIYLTKAYPDGDDNTEGI